MDGMDGMACMACMVGIADMIIKSPLYERP